MARANPKGIKFVFLSLEWLFFNHNFRELNQKEDELSKEALLLPKVLSVSMNSLKE